MPCDLQFHINGFHFAAQEWGERGQLPVLALHGWLDNSASFYAVAPHLKRVNLVAVDMAGHGQSHHRPGTAPYNLWEDVADVFAIADHLGWKRFALVGHSRGAMVATLAAGTFPERISHLALIEGLLPESASVLDTPHQLALSIKAIQALRKKPLSIYPELSQAIDAREQGMFPLSRAAATVLTERGVKPVAGGYVWSTDQKLLAPVAVKLTREHLAAFIARIEAPIKVILAEDGIPRRFANFQRDVAIFPQVDVVQLTGGHHLHMEQEAVDVSCTLNTFFESH